MAWLSFGCFRMIFNFFAEKRSQAQLRELEALRKERAEVEKDLELMKSELDKKKKEERQLVKQVKLQKLKKRDSLYWIKTKCLIKRRDERQELEVLRDLDVQLQREEQKRRKIMEKKFQNSSMKILEERQELESLRALYFQLYLKDLDLERHKEAQKRREKLERKHQKVSTKEHREHRYRVARLEDMEKKRDTEALRYSLTDDDLERELDAPKGSFAQHHQERSKCDDYNIEKKEGLIRDKILLQVRTMHREPATERDMAEVKEMPMLENKMYESNKQGNVTWLEIEENYQRMEKEKQISEIKGKARGEIEVLTKKQTEIKNEQEKRQRTLLPELLTMELHREVDELELDNEMQKMQKEMDSPKMELKEYERRGEIEKEKMAEIKIIKEKCKWTEVQIDKERQVVEERDMAILKRMERTLESNRQDLDCQLMKERQIGGELQITKTELEKEKQQQLVTEQERAHFWDMEDLPMSEEVSPKNEEKFEIDEKLQSNLDERIQRKEEMLLETEEQREEMESKIDNTETVREKQNALVTEQEDEDFWDMENLTKLKEDSPRNEQNSDIDKALQCSQIERIQRKEVMLLPMSQDIQYLSPKHEEKMEKKHELMQKLFPQTVSPSLQEEKQKVLETKQEEKWWTMKEHLWDSESLPKSEDIQNCSSKHEDKNEIDDKLQNNLDERIQRKEEILLETEKQREEDQIKERQERHLKIQQMQASRQKHAEMQKKRKKELMQKMFHQTLSSSLQKEGNGSGQLNTDMQHHQENSEQGKEHREHMEPHRRRNRQLDQMNKGI